MSKKKVKKKSKKKPQGKYNAKTIELVRMLVLKCGVVNRRSEIAWTKVAKCLGVRPKTIYSWLDPRKDTYKKKFDEAVEELRAEIDVGAIKRSMIDRAQGYLRIKKTVTIAETDEGELTTTKTERERMMGDVPAAKLVLANMGPVEGRWTPKEGLVHEAGGSLAQLFAEIGQQETVLPSEELGLNDQETAGTEHEEPVLANEQPVLDNRPGGPTDEIHDE